MNTPCPGGATITNAPPPVKYRASFEHALVRPLSAPTAGSSRPPTRRSFTHVQFLAVLWAGAALVGISCRAPAVPLHVEYDFDTSDATPERLIRFGKASFELQRNLPKESVLDIQTFAHAVRRVYTGPPFRRIGDFKREVASLLPARDKGFTDRGTRFDRVLADVAARSMRWQKSRLLVLWTDGGFEDGSSKVLRHISTSLQALQISGKCLAIVFVGVDPAFRAFWQEELAKAGLRGDVLSLTDPRVARLTSVYGDAK